MDIKSQLKITPQQRDKAVKALRDFYQIDMRWSFIVAVGLIVLGIVINIVFTNGWIIWPFLVVVGVMSMIHEAAERNGQGVPPFYAYAFLAGIILAWVLIAAVFSVINPHVLLFGLVALAYQCAKAWLHDRERTRILEARRAAGQCIHCGEIADPKLGMCMNCGNEPDPIGARMRRVASMVYGAANTAHARATIKGESTTASAKQREQALLARHRERTRPKRY